MGWYVALWIIAAGLAAVALITDSILMLVLVVVAALVVSLYGAKEPRILEFSLDEKSLRIDRKDYPLDTFSSFWIFEKKDHYLLSLDARKAFQPNLKIIIPPDKVGLVRRALSETLEEKEQDESLIEEIADRLRF